MQRYWEGETTPAEERKLARYAARTNDPAFKELRGVLGYLSIGRERKHRQARPRLVYSWAAVAAALVILLSVGIVSRNKETGRDMCILYAYGETSTDSEQIMASVEASLADFFAGESPAETNLIEMFRR